MHRPADMSQTAWKNHKRKMNRQARINNADNAAINNTLSGLVDSVKTSALIGNAATGGSYLSGLGTIAYSSNYSLLSLQRVILTYLYTGNGIFQTAVQLPVQDALSKQFKIESNEMSQEEIDEVMEFWEDSNLWNTVLDYFTWVRLYGGGAIIINDGDEPDQPLRENRLDRTEIEFYSVDRWELQVQTSYEDNYRMVQAENEPDKFYYLYGTPIHKSRVLRSNGKAAPSIVRRALQGWGMSEGERMVRDLNLYIKTQDANYDILDESKLDIFRLEGLAQKLATPNGTNTIQKRIQLANELKNYQNALVLDKNDEFEQKSMSFSGLAEVMNENRIGIASALRIPMVKLFGISPSGFSTGDVDLDNYNQMVESEIRAPLRRTMRKLLDVTMAHLFGYIPSYKFSWPPLQETDPEVEERIKASKMVRILSLYDRGLIDSKEAGMAMSKQNLIEIDTKAEQGLLPPQPTPPEGETVTPQSMSLTKRHMSNEGGDISRADTGYKQKMFAKKRKKR